MRGEGVQIYSVSAACGGPAAQLGAENGGGDGSRRTALLIGLHRLRPANSEHQ